MPTLLEKNSEVIFEVCLHHLSREHKTENCKCCKPDYNLGFHPNNYDCPYYYPQLQINYDILISKINKELNEEDKEKMKLWINGLNCGLIDCNRKEKITIEKIIRDILRDKKVGLLNY